MNTLSQVTLFLLLLFLICVIIRSVAAWRDPLKTWWKKFFWLLELLLVMLAIYVIYQGKDCKH